MYGTINLSLRIEKSFGQNLIWLILISKPPESKKKLLPIFTRGDRGG